MRVGVVGCGGHASTSILPNLAAAGVSIDAVCARHLDRARAAAAHYRAGAHFDDVAKMLDTVEVDGVVVVVPPDQYAAVLTECLAHGLPVFCDKPGAGSYAEARDLAAMADERGVPVVVGYQKRFAPAYVQALECTRAADFGDISLASFRWSMGPLGGRNSLRDWLFENPVHHFDLARWLCGDIDDLHVQATTVAGEFVVVVTGRTGSGAVVSIRACTVGSWWQNNESVELYGVGSSVYSDNIDTCTLRPPQRPEQVWRPNYTVPLPPNFSTTTMGFTPELAHFVEVATQNVPSRSDLASAAETLR